MSGQDVSYELIREKRALRLRQFFLVEDFAEVTVGANKCFRSLLKIALSQLRLDQQVIQTHIDFCAVEFSICQGNARPESKIRDCAAHVKHRADPFIPEHARIAEHVHQQSIGAGAGVQLAPDSIVKSREGLATFGMDLVQTALPIWISEDRPVCGGKEIPVSRVVVVPLKAYRWNLTIAQAVWQGVGSGILLGSLAQLMAAGSGR